MSANPNAFIEMKKFFNKLLYAIKNEASFAFMDKRLVKKSRVDDILCCIEANFPAEFKKRKSLKSMQFYKELLHVVKHKCIFSTSHYLIQYSEACKLIEYVITNFKRDIDYLNSLNDNMF